MENINSDLIRGNIDTIILKTMMNGDMYGLDIIKEVENKSNGTYKLKQPTLYSCLKRLENQELISSYWLDSDIGGKRHYYKLTEKGQEIIKSKQEEWSKSKLLIDNLLGDFNYDEYRLVKKEDYEKIINGKPIIQYVPVSENPNILTNNQPTINNFSDNKTDIISYDDIIKYSENEDISLTNPIDLNNPNLKQPTIFDNTTLNKNISNNLPQTSILVSNENNETITDTSIIKKEYEEVSTDINDIKIEEKRPDPYDNELIYFKSKTVEPKTEKQNEEPKNNQISFEQTSAFANNLFNNFELTKTIVEQNKPETIVQQDLFANIEMPYQHKVDNVIDEFSNNITKLNNFNYSGEEKENKKEVVESNLEENKTKLNQENTSSNDEIQTQDEINNNQESLDNLELDDAKNCFVQNNEIDFLSELNELNSSKTNTFKYDDGYEKEPVSYDNNFINNQQSFNTNNANLNNEQLSNNDNNDTEKLLFENISSSSSSQNLNYSSNTITYNNNAYSEPEIDYSLPEERNYESLFAPREELDEIIYRNVSAYSYDNPNDNYYSSLSSLYNSVAETENQNYKQKVEGLTEYAKNNFIENEELKSAKDIQSLKEEYKNEGITIKEFNKTSSFKSAKNYVMVNKLNLIKSLILLFGYVFVLTAMFIIMDSTNLKNMTGFSFLYFLYGFIPFIIYFLYYLVLYLFNPHKKVPAKHSSRVMLIISIIVTIQLLLITYCLNLQLGFYSFYQANYNHLLWIIPTIISFAPILSTVTYSILFRSKNFNI